MARLQLVQQELQDNLYDSSESDIIKREVIRLNKGLLSVQEKINETMQAICYQVAEIV